MAADEFDIIKTLFAPLATSKGARGLLDDAALIENTGQLVVTTDAIVEGVHFLADDPIDSIAKKALRVNLSDLAAKGARPVGVLVTLIWPDSRPSAQIAAFARGLGEDLRHYELALLGGDTTSSPGPLIVSVTAFGEPFGERVPARADAIIGHDVWVSGTIGDAWLGYEALRPGAEFTPWRETMIARYRLPEPRVALAGLVARHAGAAMDISDGLIGDAAKLGHASSVTLRLDAAAIPFSEAALAWREGKSDFGNLLDWGDDYEILFTADPSRVAAIVAEAARLGERVTKIGAVEAGAGVRLLGADIGVMGYAHKLGR